MPKYFYMLLVTVAGKTDAKIQRGSNSLGPVTWPVQSLVKCQLTYKLQKIVFGIIYIYSFSFPLRASSRSWNKITEFQRTFSPFVSRVSNNNSVRFHPYVHKDTITMQLYQPCNNVVSTGRGVRIDELEYSIGLHEGAGASLHTRRTEKRIKIISAVGPHEVSHYCKKRQEPLSVVMSQQEAASRLNQTMRESLSSLY